MIGDAKTTSEAERERKLREQTDDGEIISADDYKRRSRRSFLAFAGLGVAGYAGFKGIQSQSPADGDNIPPIIRSGLRWNEGVWETVQRDGASARTFSVDEREDIRVNGRFGLEEDVPDDYAISVVGVDGDEIASLAVDDIRGLTEQSMVWEHKCIEGWSNIVNWTGARFSDFVERFAPDQTDWEYVSLVTPNEEYYVGMERYTMMHHQTLLAWQLNGEELSPDHGAPLRLATPLKYGIKQLKRVGRIEFTNDRPADYWVERGYDFHSGF